MKQYWVLVLNSLIDIVFCAIDGAFANGISIDAVVVMGSFIVFKWLAEKFIRLGIYAYRVQQDYEINNCLLQLICGIAIGAICILLRVPISHLFDITPGQKELLQKVLIVYGIGLPIEAISKFLQTYIIYNCYNKLVIFSNVSTYIIMLLGDWIAVRYGFGIVGIVASTEISWLIYGILVYICCKFYKSTDKIDFKIIMKSVMFAKDMLFSQLVERASTLFLGHFASTMTTMDYAIHSVALAITSQVEEFRCALRDYSLVNLKKAEDKVECTHKVFKQTYFYSLILGIIGNGILVVIMHGKVDIIDTLIGTLWYMLPFLVYPMYDIVSAYLLNTEQSIIMFYGSFICLFLCSFGLWFLSLFGLSIPILGIVIGIDPLLRTLFFVAMLKHRNKVAKEKRV